MNDGGRNPMQSDGTMNTVVSSSERTVLPLNHSVTLSMIVVVIRDCISLKILDQKKLRKLERLRAQLQRDQGF